MLARFFPLYFYWNFFRPSRAANSPVLGRIWLKFELVRDIMVVLHTCKYKEDPIKNSPKGNDALLRAIIQSKKKWKHQLFRHLRAANSVVGSGRISNSSKLLCMSSLPVSMKMIPSRTTEKKGQHLFQIITLCWHGNQWSDLAKFRTHPSFYACPH